VTDAIAAKATGVAAFGMLESVFKEWGFVEGLKV
jgi:hypothetical protein